MLKIVLPIVLLLIGSGAGVGAGIFLRPPPAEVTAELDQETGDAQIENAESAEQKAPGGTPDKENPEVEYVKLSNQFVVPIVKDEIVKALVVLSLSLEVPVGSKDAVFRREPKLRDSFLQVLFDHANVGGFDGAFTSASNLSVLREALREVGQRDMDVTTIRDVLILEIDRQDNFRGGLNTAVSMADCSCFSRRSFATVFFACVNRSSATRHLP